MLYNSIFMKFRNRQTQLIVIERLLIEKRHKETSWHVTDVLDLDLSGG